jgi:hypothetical protein
MGTRINWPPPVRTVTVVVSATPLDLLDRASTSVANRVAPAGNGSTGSVGRAAARLANIVGPPPRSSR